MNVRMLALFGFLAACSDDASTTTPTTNSQDAGAMADATSAPAKGPGEFKADYKTSSAFFTNMAAPVKGSSPHGTAQIWYSSNVKDLLNKASFTAPEGTVSIKEFDMLGDGTKRGIAVMIKKPAGYDPANGDWYYDMRDMTGAIMADPPAGKIEMCINCHKGFASTDYFGGTTLK